MKNQKTFAEAEADCLPKTKAVADTSHRSQLFFSDNLFELDYVSSLLEGDSYWLGIDDRDKNGTWITSLNVEYSDPSAFFVTGDARSLPCAEVRVNGGGFASSAECSTKHRVVCETKPLSDPPDYPCPKDYIPYKDKCFMPNPQKSHLIMQ